MIPLTPWTLVVIVGAFVLDWIQPPEQRLPLPIIVPVIAILSFGWVGLIACAALDLILMALKDSEER